MIADLGLSSIDAEWVNAIYSLTFAALLIVFGRVGDRVGRRRIFTLGALVFVLASIYAASSKSGEHLITARALQGIGGAMMSPSSLSLVNSLYAGKARNVAFAIYGSIIGGMAALGPLVGGYLTTNFSWTWAFWINVPIGALAFWHHCPQFGFIQEKLNRVYTDIDFAGYGKQNDAIRKLFVSIGYDEDLEINAFHAEGGRLIFNNPTSHIHVDVFMDKLDFCHPIPWKGRLEVDNPTIPLAELLLEKMQIVKINEKDIIDTIMLLLEHEICGDDEDHINSQHVAKLCAGEWGLWRTTTMNLDKVRDYLPHLDLEDEDKQVVSQRVAELLSAMDDYPKGTRWKLRARVGDKVKWYNEID